jgi:hypothetical protein
VNTLEDIRGDRRGSWVLIKTMKKEDSRMSLEKYLLMSEKEKDAEVQKAVIRLQTRIQEILYLLEVESIHAEVKHGAREKKEITG